VTDPAEFREPHPMLSGAHGGHTISYQQLARDGVRLLGRLVDAESELLRFGPDLPANIQFADDRAARFRRAVDECVAQAGIVAPPPDTDPAERPQRGPGSFPEALNMRTERIATVVWCTGFGPDTGWLRVPVLKPDGSPAHKRGVTAFPGLYVAGCPWLSNRGSGLLYGVAADAARVAQHIAAAVRSGRARRPASRRASPGAPAHPHSVTAADASARAGTAAQPAGAKSGRGVTHIP
jgi:putative flavoprotein involved in K+ transport